LGPNRITFLKDGHQPLQIFTGHFGIADDHALLPGLNRRFGYVASIGKPITNHAASSPFTCHFSPFIY
jgi:hypothetical protein